MMADDQPEPLTMLDKTEMWDAMRTIKPDLTRVEFDRRWDEFQDLKRRKALN